MNQIINNLDPDISSDIDNLHICKNGLTCYLAKDVVMEEQFVNIPKQTYTTGTILYCYTVTDPDNRYLRLPWEDSNQNLWVETSPICKDIVVTKDNYHTSVAFFKDKKCKVWNNLTKKIVNDPIPIINTKIVSKYKLSDFVSKLITTNADMVGVKNCIKVYGSTYNDVRKTDAICNITGVQTIRVYGNIKGCEYLTLDPKLFNLDNRFEVSECHQLNRIEFVLEPNVTEISYDAIFYSSKLRYKINRAEYINFLTQNSIYN